MNRVQNILDGLQPVATGHGIANLAPDVFLYQQIPPRNQGFGSGTQVSENQPSQLLHGVVGQLNFVFGSPSGMNCFVEGLLQAAPGAVVFPSMIRTSQAIVFWNSVD